MYGFKKAKKGVAKNGFYNPHFNKHSKENIKLIKRRKNCRSMLITDENIPPMDTISQKEQIKQKDTLDTIEIN